MTTTVPLVAALADDTVLTPAPSVLEAALGIEAVVWGPSPVPLHLNPPALATWWQFDGPTRVDVAVRGVADTFAEPVERVAPGVRAAVAALLDAGVLLDPSAGPPPPASPEQATRTAAIGAPAEEWLARRASERVDLTIGRCDVGVAADTGHAARAVADRFSRLRRGDGPPAPVRYLLVDAGPGPGARHWLLSDSGLPLGAAASLDEVLDGLAAHLGADLAVQTSAGSQLRLGLLEADDHCVAVQWDLLANRPVLEGRIRELGYRIAPRQWVGLDADLGVAPVVPVDAGATPSGGPVLPLRGAVLWFGPGSLDEPHTPGEWVWSVVMMACAGADHRPVDREGLVATAHRLVTTAHLVGLTDPGPSALVTALTELARRQAG